MSAPRLVPVLLRVQRIGAWMRQNHRGKRAARNSRDEDFGLREFLEHDQALAPHAPLLERALAHRALFVVIDGMDEAGGLREMLEELITTTLLPAAARVVVTCRPEGVRRDRAAELRRCAHGSPGAREASCAMLLRRVSATDPAYRLLARSGALA